MSSAAPLLTMPAANSLPAAVPTALHDAQSEGATDHSSGIPHFDGKTPPVDARTGTSVCYKPLSTILSHIYFFPLHISVS
jgi:hypothetical protein